MTDREQPLAGLDSRDDKRDQPDVEAHKLAEADRLDREDGVDRIDRVDGLGGADVEAHRFDRFEGRREKLE